jgi:hypothetical protein
VLAFVAVVVGAFLLAGRMKPPEPLRASSEPGDLAASAA